MPQASAPGREDLRRLTELRLETPVVLSLYLGLPPSEFATPPARSTAIRSVLDEAGRKVREREGLSHQDRVDLERSLERARDALEGLSAEGVHGAAVFAAEPAGLFELIKLPRAVDNRVAIDRTPLVGPLAGMEHRERWCVALVNRRDGRVFQGGPEGLRELQAVHDDVHGQHDQGGWSQKRYERSVEKEKADHLKNVADLLLRRHKRTPCQRLVVGGPHEVVAEFETKLHPYLQELLAGRVDVDVERANGDDVLAAAAPLLEEVEEQREREALERVDQGAHGRAVGGLADVLAALNEHRVETLLLEERFADPGVECPECGWLGPEGPTSCPADETALEAREDVTEAAVELALRQSAEVLPMRRLSEGLEHAGGIGALLRF